MELRRPTLADKETVLAMMTEFEKMQSDHDGGFWDKERFDYEDWLASNQDMEIGLNLPDGWVPAIQLLGFVDDEAVGFLNLRLVLNDYLLNQGGHIGYSVRPSVRGKGYAKDMLMQSLPLAKNKNIQRVLVTCRQDNPASRSVIVANGGQLEDVREGVERYWIDLT
ncbi:acetyltransferase, gnat family [Streptococcus varani]|uniref:Acetyltransferase, gnat family n=1 Tax=Streptococcus varani TaxID=1608583 RepID=A0A0E3WEK6_9STRE|nr:GNAT family N-acetyltransferase [Streptococcus varani]CQR23845.1 acetyltransferase, gnat family [Streptococcus varani]